MIFTRKKFRLIGDRARIKKTLQIVEDLLPAFTSPYDLQHIPMYLDFLITLNGDASKYQFSDDEIDALQHYRHDLSQWDCNDVPALKHPFSSTDKQRFAKILLKTRQVLNDKIQAPIRESSLIILERDPSSCEPLVWPQEVVVVLDHLRSPYNVGAITRTMECVGLNRLLSIGYTPRLDSRQVQRSAMGCDAWMDVEYVDDGLTALEKLKSQNFSIYVLETVFPSRSMFALDKSVFGNRNIAFVVGNEEFGVDESIIAMADQLLHIPTFGKKNSLNVSIAFSIAIYQVWSALFAF
jgi:tRNA G18 (ribose-2'-O)-methylase SpoU